MHLRLWRSLNVMIFLWTVVTVGAASYTHAQPGPVGRALLILFLLGLFIGGALLAWVISRRFAAEYAAHTDRLYERLHLRTRRLTKYIGRLRKLKATQDADYYLTTQLLEPLAVNNAQGDNHRVEFFTQQKKKFAFRKWSKEIGGDINISHTVYLHGRRYLVFVNADAMGKSLQGAGGALVFGSVVLSIIARTKNDPHIRKLYPEKWLSDVYQELNHVFESFSGSMFVSGFMGLVDDEQGLVYYVNAEHPDAVLWRDGAARFISRGEGPSRKLGMRSDGKPIHIRTLQLLPGDYLILGSDGRDDIQLGVDSRGRKIINENEQRFLTCVRSCRGDLEQIAAEIAKQGDLTDDLSLLKICRLASKDNEADGRAPDSTDREQRQAAAVRRTQQCRDALRDGEFQKAERELKSATKEFPLHAPFRKALAKVLYRQGRFEEALPYAELYAGQCPGDADFLKFVAWCFRQCNKWEEATVFAERYRLRDPNDLSNLKFLIECYFTTGEEMKLLYLIDMVLEREPNNPYLAKMRAKFIQKSILGEAVETAGSAHAQRN